MPAVIPLPVLLTAARALAWAHHGAIVRLSTLDGTHWTCVAIDPETGEWTEHAPTGADTSPEGAVTLFLGGIHEEAVTPERAALRTLAQEFPTGYVREPDGDVHPLTGDADADLVAAERPLARAVGGGR